MMKFRKRDISARLDILYKILLNPILAGTLLGILILWLLPPFFSKYRAEVLRTEVFRDDRTITVADLDDDGSIEKIHALHNNDAGAVVMITSDGRTWPEISLEGKYMPEGMRVISGDTDHDGKKELYAVTLAHDTAFLWIVIPGKEQSGKPEKVFISKVCTHGGRVFCNIDSPILADLDGDGYDEMNFLLNAGYCAEPRTVFSYDVRRKKTNRSPESYASIVEMNMVPFRGTPLLTLTTVATGNVKDGSLPFGDSSSWLQVLTARLGFLFPPVRFKTYYSILKAIGLNDEGSVSIFSLFYNYGKQATPNSLCVYDIRGRKTRDLSRLLGDQPGNRDIFKMGACDSNLYLLRTFRGISMIDGRGIHLKERQISNAWEYLGSTDADGDGSPEAIVSGADARSIYIVRNGLKEITEIRLAERLGRYHELSSGPAGEGWSFFIYSGSAFSSIKYQRNTLYLFKYPFYLLVLMASVLFVHGIQAATRYQVRRRIRSENRIRELQLIASMNQLDPHFTFNVMNTISSVALKGETEQAYNLTVSFAGMIRSSLRNAGSISRSLEEELEFVGKFIDITKSSMDFPFEYICDIGEDVDLKTRVPKMMLQTFVENAVKHGLKPLDRAGVLKIQISKSGNELIIVVQDDGAGINSRLNKPEHSAGKGLALVDELISILNQQNKRHIRLNITDLEGERGTRVELHIPEGYSYMLV